MGGERLGGGSMQPLEIAGAVVVVLAAVAGCSRPSAGPTALDPVPTPSVGDGSAVGLVRDERPRPACGDPGDVLIFTSPERAIAGQPLRVVAVSDRLVDASRSEEHTAELQSRR